MDPAIGSRLSVLYVVRCAPEVLKIPEPSIQGRTDGLWNHTCFELFIKPEPGSGYLEFNYSPSGQWAAYEFSDYRANMRQLDIPAPDRMSPNVTEHGFTMQVSQPLGPELEKRISPSCKVGISAVIEEMSGAKSYWALNHPTDKPDFHHPDGFALTLPTP